jgi:hypothetical protein
MDLSNLEVASLFLMKRMKCSPARRLSSQNGTMVGLSSNPSQFPPLGTIEVHLCAIQFGSFEDSGAFCNIERWVVRTTYIPQIRVVICATNDWHNWNEWKTDHSPVSLKAEARSSLAPDGNGVPGNTQNELKRRTESEPLNADGNDAEVRTGKAHFTAFFVG